MQTTDWVGIIVSILLATGIPNLMLWRYVGSVDRRLSVKIAKQKKDIKRLNERLKEGRSPTEK